MNYEVVVVGGGIGGMAVAALLAARGVSVCLFERQSRPGGCVASFEHSGYSFEPTAGLYSGWEPGGVYAQIFSKLPITPPEVRRLAPAYKVRLPDQNEVAVSGEIEEFEAELCRAFPECAQAAVDFYRHAARVVEAPSSATAEGMTSALLSACSERFQRFIDVQLQTFTQSASDQCSFLEAAYVLTTPRRGMWTIRGGAQSLADTLAQSLKQSGGRLRLDAPVLRLAYAADGAPIGVDLLSGERVIATRAIVSNLTVWDTYGKLIGLGRTPPDVSKQLKRLRAWGTYSVFLGMDQAQSDLPKSTTLVMTDWQHGKEYEPDQSQLTFAPASAWDSRGPAGKLAVTASTFTHAEDWFSFHEDETSHEQQDQAALESLWSRLHLAMPELGDRVEVIETSTPQTLYETTRRKFGMTGRIMTDKLITGKISTLPQAAEVRPPFGTTIFPNVFLIGDTVSSEWGLEGICNSALALAQALI